MTDYINAIIPVAPGELVDKITILEIKKKKIKQKTKTALISKELEYLKITLDELINTKRKVKAPFTAAKKKLYNINLKLWDIENKIRAKEAKQIFDKEFIQLARSVYKTNDKRSEIKNSINNLFGSSFHEVKQYSSY